MISLGVDTLTYHLRLEKGALTVEDVLLEAAGLGCGCVQVTLHHVRDRDLASLHDLRARADELGVKLLASGDVLGRAHEGDDPAGTVGRVQAWLERAQALGSPILRVTSGFYRADLADRPELIELERRFVIESLELVLPAAQAAGIRLLLENHSDFRVEEYQSILTEVGTEQVGVFLDLINPISGFQDPLPIVAALAPYAWAGHAKDYRLISIPTDDGYHRRGFQVTWCYPGEGAADLRRLVGALKEGVDGRDVFLSIEGLDNYADRSDQGERLASSLALLRPLLA
jgi:sugar phosphate isomerase/epimerase